MSNQTTVLVLLFYDMLPLNRAPGGIFLPPQSYMAYLNAALEKP